MTPRAFKLAAVLFVAVISIDPASADNATATTQTTNTASDDAALLKRGRIMFLRCRSCHTLNEGGRHLTGPNLHGLLDAKSAAKDYAYSDALKESGVVWTEENLDKWIESPNGLVKGNRMVFGGLRRAEDRKALIAYLKQETK